MSVNHLSMTEDQKAITEGLREILEKELVPVLDEYEEKGEFPMEVFKKLHEAGYHGITLPEEYGGWGLDYVTKCMIYEEIAKIDAGFAFSFCYATPHMQAPGNPEQQQYIADKILDGSIAAFCLTEPDAGSDAGAMRTTAVRDGDEYVLNGTKAFITNGTIADLFLVVAITDPELGANKGSSLFLVEKEHGVKCGKHEDKMGFRLSDTSQVIFEDVRIPASNLLGEEGKGFKYVLKELEQVRCFSMAFAVGVAQSAIDRTVKFARDRKTFGKAIIDHQGLAFKIAEMEILTQASRSAILYVAGLVDQGVRIGPLSSSIKAFVSDASVKVTDAAIQCFGGYGYMKEYKVEKLMRDAKLFPIYEGTNEIQKVVLSRYLKDKKDIE
jgi:alkylation response protein AidB-like acyl-CoA dehydrogenase